MPRLNHCRRQCFGYVQTPQNQNNPTMIQSKRKLSTVNTVQYKAPLKELAHNSMSGEGLMDTMRRVFEKGKSIAGRAEDLYTSDLGTTLRNLVPDSDDTARPGFPGEKHAILKLANGKNGIANYMGPGTEVIKRVKRGDPGRTFSDKVAKRHDIDYAFAGAESTKEKQLKAIREADNRMISTLSKNKDKDASRNINMGLQLIRAKKLGEDLGVLSKSKFAGELTKMSDADKMLMMNARRQTTQEGFGISMAGGTLMPVGSGIMLPGEKLKLKLIKQELRKKSKSANLLSSIAGSGKSKKKKKKMKGKGLSPTHVKLLKSAGSALVSDVMPDLLTKLGINIPSKVLGNIIHTTLGVEGSLKDKVKLLVGNLMPLFAVKKTQSMSGSGLKLAGQGMNLSGRGLQDIMSLIPTALSREFEKFLLDYLKKWFTTNTSGKQRGKGYTLSGAGFWDDFARGFKMVFKPGGKILGAVATALGMPEIGIPLSAVSEAL